MMPKHLGCLLAFLFLYLQGPSPLFPADSDPASVRITAFDIDSGRWGGVHHIFLELISAGDERKGTPRKENLSIRVNGETRFPTQLIRRDELYPLRVILQGQLDGFSDYNREMLSKSVFSFITSKSDSTSMKILGPQISGDSFVQDPEVLKQFVLRLNQTASFDPAIWLLNSSEGFPLDKTRRVMIVITSELPRGNGPESEFWGEWKKQLEARQITPWLLINREVPEWTEKWFAERGGGVRFVSEQSSEAVLKNIQLRLQKEYLLTYDPDIIGNVPYQLRIQSREQPAAVVEDWIDAGPIIPWTITPHGYVGILFAFSGSLIILFGMWVLRKPRVPRHERPGFIILNRGERERFIEIPENTRSLEFLNEIGTRKKLRLSSNLNRVVLTQQQKTFLLEDKNYKNALLINRRRTHRTILYNNDILDIGELILLYRNSNAPLQSVRRPSTRERPVPLPPGKPRGPLRRETPSLSFVGSRQEYPLLRNITIIGSSNMNDLVLQSDEISPRHAKISRIGGVWKIQNLSTQEFTLINGRRIEQRILIDGDEITIGDAVCRFRLSRGTAFVKDRLKEGEKISEG